MNPNHTETRVQADPSCQCCHGMGRYVVGYSGREDDGNALLWDDCDCFIPVDASGVSPSDHQDGAQQTPTGHHHKGEG